MAINTAIMNKTWLYIDGYNFYYAIKSNDELPVFLAWCDFRQLAEKHSHER
ncbi:MAG: NYN domain-containing protein [bacterium]|nr:NYN domain-containing protein [bacterium]